MGTCCLCAKCCEQTEMLLANEDVERIKKQTNVSNNQFSYVKGGYIYLKNKGGYCVFLTPETKKCSIYEIRPKGCRFYPIVYDSFLDKSVVDKDCSNKDNISENLIESVHPKLRKFILLLEEERNKRLNQKMNGMKVK